MELVLIRHGLPERTLESPSAGDRPEHSPEHGGHADPAPPPSAPDLDLANPGLSPTGADEARKVAAWLQGEHIAAIYASPLRRARETAAPVSELLQLSISILDGLAEWDRDADAYVHMEDLQARDDPIWHALAGDDLASLGIDPNAFRRRVVETIDGIAASHRSQTVAVFCHGGVINTYTADVAGLDRTLWFSPDYGGISRVRVSSSGIRSIVSLNETGHLR